jgi:hypothetical protein
MRRAGWLGLLLGVSLALGQTPLTDRTGVIVRPNNGNFAGTCATRQVGMAGSTGATFMCVAGTWRRQDLANCLATDVAGAQCTYSSLCVNRSEGAIYVCNSSNLWQQISGGTGGGGGGTGEFNYSQAFSSATSVTLAHNLGTENVLVSCYDSDDIQIYPDTVDIGTADPWDVVVTFEVAQTGRCVVNGSGNGTMTGGGDPGTGGFPDLREDGAARINDAEFIDFLAGFDVNSTGQVSLDYSEKPVNLASTEVTGTLPITKGGTGATSFTANTCIRYNGTSLVSAASDCGGGGGGGGSFCGDTDNDCRADLAEDVNCNQCITLNAETIGLLSVGQGGTGMSVVAADAVVMGANASVLGMRGVPDCDESSQKLMYDASDNGSHPNLWYCATDYQNPSGSGPQGPEGAIQFYEGGALGSNAGLYWTESSSVFRAVNIEASGLWRGTGLNARWDLDRDGSYDLELARDGTAKSYIGLRTDGDYIRWPTFSIRPNGLNYLQLDFTVGDGTDTPVVGDFCIRQNGIDSNCDSQVDFNPLGTEDAVLVGNAGSVFVQKVVPDCFAAGQALTYSQSGAAGTFSCLAAGGGGAWAKGLDVGQDGTNVQLEADGTTLDMDPDADGTLEARVNADGSLETFGSADESGGMGSNGKLIFSADDNNNGTGEGMDWDFDGDGTYELSAAGTGTLTMVTGAVIPGVCLGATPATTTTLNDCNSATFTATTVTITTINTCDAANRGRQITLMCNSSGQTIGTGGNLKPAGAASFACAADDTWTAICDGTNWREIARSAN